MRLETAGQLVLNNQSKIRTSLLHLLDGFRTVFQADDEGDGGVGLPKFPQDGRKNHLRHRCAKDHAQLRAGFILARYRLRRAIEAAKNPQDLAEEVPAFGRQVSGLSLFIDKPAAELILRRCIPWLIADWVTFRSPRSS
jgi:hypothetical protein